MSFAKLKQLLSHLIERKDDLPDRNAADRQRDKKSDWWIVDIHKAFPDQNCTSLGSCIIQLSHEYIKTKSQLEQVAGDLVQLGQLAYNENNQVQFNSMMCKGLFPHEPDEKKKAELRAFAAKNIFFRTQQKKHDDREGAEERLKKRIHDQIQLEMSDVLRNIRDGIKSPDFYSKVIALETASAQRGRDILLVLVILVTTTRYKQTRLSFTYI